MNTKPILLSRLALSGAVALFAHTALAQTFQTVDDFQYVPGKLARAMGVTTDLLGHIIVAGFGLDAQTNAHALLMKSSDAGTSWSVLDDFVYATGTTTENLGVICDPAGTLYTLGQYGLGSSSRLIVRRSFDGALTWSIVDELVNGTVNGGHYNSITTDRAGYVYTIGSRSISNVTYWVVRRGIPLPGGSMSWSYVDQFRQASSTENYAYGITSDSAGRLFVAGTANSGARYNGTGGTKLYAQQFIVRRSLDAGTTWATVDVFQLDPSGASAHGAGADAAGNVYAVGHADTTSKGKTTTHWLVRKSSNGGGTWATIDDYPTGFAGAGVKQFAADSHGNLFVSGQYSMTDSWGWIVRMRPAGTAVWQTVDTFQYAANRGTVPTGIVTDPSGNAFVVGSGEASLSEPGIPLPGHWLVRKRSATP